MSSRKRAGSRKGNNHKTFASDWTWNFRREDKLPMAVRSPNHAKREADIRACFPLAPGVTPPAKLHG